MKKFIAKNVVVISGVLSAIALVLQQSLSNHTTDIKAIGLASLIALLSFVANQWKGQGITVFGIISTLAGVFIQQWDGAKLDWNTFALAAIYAVITTLSTGLNSFKEQTPTQ